MGWKVAARPVALTISRTSTRAYRFSEPSRGIRSRKGREICGGELPFPRALPKCTCRLEMGVRNPIRAGMSFSFSRARASAPERGASAIRFPRRNREESLAVIFSSRFTRVPEILDRSTRGRSRDCSIGALAELSRLLSSRDRSRVRATCPSRYHGGWTRSRPPHSPRPCSSFFFPRRSVSAVFFAPPPFRLRIAINRRDSRGTITQIFPPYITPRAIHRGEACKKFSSTEYNLLSRREPVGSKGSSA